MEDTTGNRGRVSASVNNRDRRLIADAVSAIERVGVEKAVEMSGLPRSTIMGFRSGKKPKFIYEKTRKALRALLRFSPKPTPPTPPPPEPKHLTADDYLAQRAMKKKKAAEPEPEPEPDPTPVDTIDPLMKLLQRMVDALEVSAVALTIIAEKFDDDVA
jgi:hypothetical protein